jgi:hypothetical protein
MTDTDAVREFTSCLSAYARTQYSGQATHVQLLKALGRGWMPKQIADACSRDLPRTGTAWRLIQTRIDWHAQNDPPGTGQRTRPKTGPEGCSHTTDPNGWLMDKDGRLTGKCPCWSVIA